MSNRFDLSQLVRASSGTNSLPGDYVELSARRLGIAAAIAGAVYLLYIGLYQTVWRSQSSTVGLLCSSIGMLISIAAALYLLGGQRPAARVAFVAVAYEVLLTFGLAVSESWTVSYAIPSAQVSWSAVIIVLFPFLIPASTRAVLAASIASAATVPLAMALVFASSGRTWPDASVVASYVLPPFLCALLSWAPTSALHRLGAAVRHARRLGNYELRERLGQGGMGEVWLANHRLLARPAAVKLIRPEVLGAKDATSQKAVTQRFEKEAQATASLESPHSVELYDFGVSSEGVLFYVMELLHGVDVQTLVERFGPLPPERVIHLLMQACDSLDDAHRRGLVHRDIKPANLFVARKGGTCDFLKVLDFGLVKHWRADDALQSVESIQGLAGELQHTAFGQIVGTPAFLAPEVALGEHAIDSRADLYSLGCVAYWMLTGALVFDEASAVAMAAAHVTKVPVPPSNRANEPIGIELEQIVMRCLHKDREQRPRSAQALRDLLAAVPLGEPWSRKRAATWWRAHLPELVPSHPAELS